MTIIDQINERLTTEEVLDMVPGLEKQGSNFVGKCPTGHDSKSGKSFQVNTIEPTFHCFNCGVGGSYIHLVELVNFGTSSSGKGGTESFKHTLKLLADKYNLNNTDQEYNRNEAVFDIIEFCVADYARQLKEHGQSLMDGIVKKYGLTKEFIQQEKWGYGYECPSIRAREFWTNDELLSTGLFNESKKCHTGMFHIYQTRIVMPYNNMGRTRYTIGRKTKMTKGWPAGATPPKYFKQYIQKETRPYVSPAIKNEIVRCNKSFDEVIITEGITDYLMAKMHNLNAVSAVTTSFKKDEYQKVVDFCKKFQTVYVVNDNDKNEAGQKGAQRICEMLVESGIIPHIVILPLLNGADKTDLSEFVRDNGIGRFHEVKLGAEKYIDFLINQIPSTIDKDELLERLKPISRLLSFLPKELAEIYILDKIKTRFKLAAMKNMLKSIMDSVQLKQMDLKEERKLEGPNSEDIFNDNSGDIQMISSGQDYKDGVLYYTITRPHQVTDKNGIIKIVNKPFQVASDRRIIEIQDGQILSDGFALSRKVGLESRFEGWSFKDSDYSVEKYVKGEVDINPYKLYLEIRNLIQKHVFFKYEYESAFLAVAIMTWPMYMIFNAIGYIHLWAEKRSGKTTVMEILYALGFNSMMSSSMTDAAIFRSIEMYRPVLLIDEAENLNPTAQARDNGQTEKLELLKSGYKKSGSATRCEGQNNSVVTFHNYSPKVFAGTKKADNVLADRMIMIAMKRAKEGVKIEELIEAKVKDHTDNLRDMTYCFGMQHAAEIEKIYLHGIDSQKEKLAKHKVIFRAKELWTPYLCTALLIDKHNTDKSVFDLLLKKALAEEETAAAFGGDSKSMEVIEQLYIWTKKVQLGAVNTMTMLHEGDVYLRKGITDSFINGTLKGGDNEDDYKYMNFEKLKQALRKYDVIDKDSELKNYRMPGRRGSALRLSPQRLIESLITYKNHFDEDVLGDIQKYREKNKMVRKLDKVLTFDNEEID